MRVSLPTSWAACPQVERPHHIRGAPDCWQLKTNGNGACALHAVWGEPRPISGKTVELYRADVRDMLLQSLPGEFADLEAAVPMFARGMLQSWFRAAWGDAVKFDDGDWESEYVRRHLPRAIQE